MDYSWGWFAEDRSVALLEQLANWESRESLGKVNVTNSGRCC
jgi:hypothetical protein